MSNDWQGRLKDLNRGPARITLNGKRHYVTPLETGPAPSVTTILSETASEANKKKLEMWSKANPGVKEAAAERGTAIHFGMEQYLKGNKTPDIKEDYADFWSGMPAILDQFTEVLWAESPIRSDLISLLALMTWLVCGVAMMKGGLGLVLLTSLAWLTVSLLLLI